MAIVSDLGLNHEALAAAWATREHTRVCPPHMDFDHSPPRTGDLGSESGGFPSASVWDL